MHEYQRDHDDAERRLQRGWHDPRGPEPTARDLAAAATGRIDALGPEAALRLQRHAGNDAVRHSLQRSRVHDVVDRSGGAPVPEEIVSTVESGYGPMPAGARMHTDAEALASAREVGAYAYATGRDIVIPADAPREVQLEEAFHLAQQLRHGDGARSELARNDLGNGVAVSDNEDAYERQAQDLARRYATASAHTAHTAHTARNAAPAAGTAAPVQRSADEDLAVQRSTAGDAAPAGSDVDEEPVPEEDGVA